MIDLDWQNELGMALKILYSCFLGAVVGLERECHRGAAGIRTYAAVSMGACSFGLISMHAGAPDPTRIAAQVVTGIGFIGAGLILKQADRTIGLTSAATIWATASVGLGVAFGMVVMATLCAVLVFGLLALHHLPVFKKSAGKFTYSEVGDEPPTDK